MQHCVDHSRDWQQKLEEGLKLWRRVQEKAKPLEDWLQQAEKVLKMADDSDAVQVSN